MSTPASAVELPATAAQIVQPPLPRTVEDLWTGTGACLTNIATLQTEIDRTLKVQTATSRLVSETVGRFRFVNQPRVLVASFRRLMSGVSGTGLQARSCRTVECAAEQVFGPGVGLRLLALDVRYNLNGSHFGERGVMPWQGRDLDAILVAAGDLPRSVLPFEPGLHRRILLDRRIERHAGPGIASPGAMLVAISATSARTGIRVGKVWDARDASFQRTAIVHELAHDFLRSQQALFDARGRWQRAMIADAFRRVGTRLPASSVSAYANTSLDEDFAESVVAYRYMPDMLRSRAPHRYQALKYWLFDGLEYARDADCSEERSMSNQFAALAINTLAGSGARTHEYSQLMSECLEKNPKRTADRRGRLRSCMISRLFPHELGSVLADKVSTAAPVNKAIVTSRLRNRQFARDALSAVDDTEAQAIIDTNRTQGCGGSCHTDHKALPAPQ